MEEEGEKSDGEDGAEKPNRRERKMKKFDDFLVSKKVGKLVIISFFFFFDSIAETFVYILLSISYLTTKIHIFIL